MTQKKIIMEQLLETGRVTRNWCLRNYISRLGAIIHILKGDGWDFKSYWDDGDYVYELITTAPVNKCDLQDFKMPKKTEKPKLNPYNSNYNEGSLFD